MWSYWLWRWLQEIGCWWGFWEDWGSFLSIICQFLVLQLPQWWIPNGTTLESYAARSRAVSMPLLHGDSAPHQIWLQCQAAGQSSMLLFRWAKQQWLWCKLWAFFLFRREVCRSRSLCPLHSSALFSILQEFEQGAQSQCFCSCLTHLHSRSSIISPAVQSFPLSAHVWIARLPPSHSCPSIEWSVQANQRSQPRLMTLYMVSAH